MVVALARALASLQLVISAAALSSSTVTPACKQSAPRMRILIAHEQHLRAMGCDQRLLGVISALVQARQEVSLFFRSSTPPALRSPSSSALAKLLRIQRGFKEEWLREDVRRQRPPAMYEYTTSRQLALLFEQGWFDAVLVFFWFWYDPKPNVAEIVLPFAHAYSPPRRRPHLSILTDDAHSVRDYRLARWESDPELKTQYAASAMRHAERQRISYMLVNRVLYLTRQDSEAEQEAFPFLSREKLGLLRLSPKSFVDPRHQRAPLGRDVPDGELRVGFLGHGGTPTNYLAIRWFLNECWPALRRLLPKLRLRLVGEPPAELPLPQHGDTTGTDATSVDNLFMPADNAAAPGSTSNGRASRIAVGTGHVTNLSRSADGKRWSTWAKGTAFYGVEAANGIDVLGFLSADNMYLELASWRAMVIPILSTTGINTKVYTALRQGLPLVISTTAAAPFDFPVNETSALVATSAADFVAQTRLLCSSSAQWRNVAQGSLRHWEHLLQHDSATDDVSDWLGVLCQSAQRGGDQRDAATALHRQALPHLPVVSIAWPALWNGSTYTKVSTRSLATSGSSLPSSGRSASGFGRSNADSKIMPTECLMPSNQDPARGAMNGRRAVLVLVHLLSTGNSTEGRRLVGSIWSSICSACSLECAVPIWAGGKPVVEVPANAQIAVVVLANQQMVAPDFGRLSGSSLLRLVHVIVDLDDVSPRADQQAKTQHGSGLGVAATQLLLQSHAILERERSENKTLLLFPLVRTVCQERSAWRHALRFAGFMEASFQLIWRRLARDLPAAFGATSKGHCQP